MSTILQQSPSSVSAPTGANLPSPVARPENPNKGIQAETVSTDPLMIKITIGRKVLYFVRDEVSHA